jgi:hypothetical protein
MLGNTVFDTLEYVKSLKLNLAKNYTSSLFELYIFIDKAKICNILRKPRTNSMLNLITQMICFKLKL